VTLLAVSDGGADVPKNYGSFGWVLATEHEIQWERKGIARGYPMQSYRTEGYGRLYLLSLHYVPGNTNIGRPMHRLLLRQPESSQKRRNIPQSGY
jgi:hypothetical protein